MSFFLIGFYLKFEDASFKASCDYDTGFYFFNSAFKEECDKKLTITQKSLRLNSLVKYTYSQIRKLWKVG